MDSKHTSRTAKEPWRQPDTEDEVILDQPDTEDEVILDQPDTEDEAILDQPDTEDEVILDQPDTATPGRKPQVLGEPGRDRPAPAGLPPKPPKGRKNRRKLLVTVLVALVALAVVVGAFNQSLGSQLLKMAGIGSQQATPQPTTTPQSASTPVATSTNTLTAGALILLNPGVVRQGASMNVMGSGFDAKATIDLVLKRQATGSTLASTIVQADKSGTFTGVTLNVPNNLPSGTFVVLAQERNSTKVAQAVGTIAGGVPQVKLSAQVAQPGDMLVFSLHGFSPQETINIYWNSMGGQPVGTVKADGGGGVGQGSVQVPFGAVGTNTFLFVGSQSQALAAAPVLLLSLYPTVTLSSYALKADNTLSFSGKGFGPSERVFVFLNTLLNNAPVAVIQSDAHGAFHRAGSYLVSYLLKGKQTLIFMGEQSRTPLTVAFTVLPYTPTAMASTYGGLPGTTVSFYASGFASNEVVHVYLGHTQGAGNMVSCFRTDGRGNAGAVGSYVIPGNAQGKLTFALVGTMSGGVGLATMTVQAAPTPVQVPAQPPFTCSLDTTPTTSTTPTAPAAPAAPAAPQAPTTP